MTSALDRLVVLEATQESAKRCIMRRIMPIVFVLVGVFFMLIPIVGSKSEPETVGNNTNAVGAISFVFGLLIAIYSGYHVYKSFSTNKS
jgi:hypothetical protein